MAEDESRPTPESGSGRGDSTKDPRTRDLRASRGSSGLGLELAFQFVAAILLFLFLGRWLDSKLGTAPWLLILGVFLGAGAAFFSIYRKLMGAQRRDAERRRAERHGA
jgi:ATP synthase protein I